MKKATDPSGLASVLVAAQSGDRDAQTQLASMLMSELEPLIAKAHRVVPLADKEDALHETFLLLVHPRTAYDPRHPRANPRAYCFNAARSVGDWRGRERQNARSGEVAVDDLQAPTNAEAEVRDDLRAARQINPTLFAVVAAVAYHGDTAKAAGARFGMTASRVCRAIQRYSAQCREALLAA